MLRVQSLTSFVPEDQPAKLKLIEQGARVLGPALNPESIDEAPTDQENVDSLKSSVESLRRAAGDGKGVGAVGARRLADALQKLAVGLVFVHGRFHQCFGSCLAVFYTRFAVIGRLTKVLSERETAKRQ